MIRRILEKLAAPSNSLIVNSLDYLGETPLLHAIRAGLAAVVHFLIEHEADTSSYNSFQE